MASAEDVRVSVSITRRDKILATITNSLSFAPEGEHQCDFLAAVRALKADTNRELTKMVDTERASGSQQNPGSSDGSEDDSEDDADAATSDAGRKRKFETSTA